MITVISFGQNVVADFRSILPDVLLKDPQGIVLDLRNNGGGLLDACVDVMSEFLPDEIVVTTKGRYFGQSGDIRSQSDGSLVGLPVVVLVNRGSASAAEIFAGAMQDHQKGVVIGQQTFGKGSVQNLILLPDGSSLKITIAEWLTPKGRSIHDAGIMPDILLTDEDEDDEIDEVLEHGIDLVTSSEDYQEAIGKFVEHKPGVVTFDEEEGQ